MFLLILRSRTVCMSNVGSHVLFLPFSLNLPVVLDSLDLNESLNSHCFVPSVIYIFDIAQECSIRICFSACFVLVGRSLKITTLGARGQSRDNRSFASKKNPQAPKVLNHRFSVPNK